MCLGGGSVPSAPSTGAYQSGSANIGNMASGAAANQLNWAQGQVANNSAVAGQQQGTLAGQTGTDVGANAAGAGMYGQTLGGLGSQLQTAQNYGNTAGMNQASANAEASTGQAYDAARQNNMRQLGSYGVDPSQMKSGALNLNANLAQAGAVGNAGYQAGQQRQLTGMGLVSNALNQNMMGSQVGQGYGAGANATGSTVANIGNQTTATGSNALTAPSTMMNAANSGYGSAANIANQSFQQQMQSYGANQQNANSLMSGIGDVAGIAAMAAMADGGSPVRGRYDNGGSVAQSVPTSGVTPVMSDMGAGQSQSKGGGGNGLMSGFMQGAGSGVGQAIGGALAQHQANAMLPGTQAQIAADPQMQQLQQPTMDTGAQPEFSVPHADGGMPGHGDPNQQRKRYDYGNPAVQHNQQPMAPPLVNIPGPWVGANGGSPGPGLIQHGASDGTGIDDQVPARVSVGEYIIPADVVHAKGKEFFDQLLKRYHMPAQQQRQQMGVH